MSFWLGLTMGLIAGLLIHIMAVVFKELFTSIYKPAGDGAMKRFRSAITGRFVALWYALLNPFTTIAEKIRHKS